LQGSPGLLRLRLAERLTPKRRNSISESSSPLISIHAVALDTETTGLDARTARIIEIAIVRVNGVEVEPAATFERLVNPGLPIPASASKVHGLHSCDLEKAPRFAEIGAAVQQLVDGAVVIGHNIGYDLAVLDREYARAGQSWTMPRCLDIRTLARIAAPDLASHELTPLCDWLGIKTTARHRALPDALAAACIFQGLIPLLRTRGIRTLAEAELASRHLPGQERTSRMAGWVSMDHAHAAEPAAAMAAIDSYPFQHRIRDLPLHPAAFVSRTAGLREAAEVMLTRSANGLAIVGDARDVEGFLTPADLLSAFIASPAELSDLRSVKPKSLPTICEDDFLYRALGRLQRHNSPHLGIVDRRGVLVATMSASDLLRHRVTSALVLGDEIEAASSVTEMGRAWAKIPGVTNGLLSEAIAAPSIASVIGAEIRALTAKAATMAEVKMAESGKGPPPCNYAVLVLGSAGRGDSLLSADQDNAIVYASGQPGGTEDRWFAEAGSHIAEILNSVGIPFCPGGVMAKNPGCRHDVETWKRVIDDWVSRAQVEDLLAADIFFDGVPVHGSIDLADEIFDFAFARAAGSNFFIERLASFAKDWYPPIGLFGRIVPDGDGRLDLKRNGLLPAATAARSLALKHVIRPTSTLARLSELKARSLADSDMIERATVAYDCIMREVLAQQIRDAHNGIPVSARVQVATMPSNKRAMLKRSMQAISELVATTLNP
jgi:CBS domain-containing protein